MDNDIRLDDQKREIQNLIIAKKDANDRHEQLLAAFARLETNLQTQPPQYQPDNPMDRDMGSQMFTTAEVDFQTMNVASELRTQDFPTLLGDQELISGLNACPGSRHTFISGDPVRDHDVCSTTDCRQVDNGHTPWTYQNELGSGGENVSVCCPRPQRTSGLAHLQQHKCK